MPPRETTRTRSPPPSATAAIPRRTRAAARQIQRTGGEARPLQTWRRRGSARRHLGCERRRVVVHGVGEKHGRRPPRAVPKESGSFNQVGSIPGRGKRTLANSARPEGHREAAAARAFRHSFFLIVCVACEQTISSASAASATLRRRDVSSASEDTNSRKRELTF